MTQATVHGELEAAILAADARWAELAKIQERVSAHALAQAERRDAAIRRIMERDHASYSAAEKLRETDPDYRAWKETDAKLAIERGSAEFDYWAAKLRAEYLGRTLEGRAQLAEASSYTCIHGVDIGRECVECDAGQELIR
jgi:hypothetical protein